MTTFQERERAFEAKFAHDEEFRFRVIARRDKLIADWAAERLHLPGSASADLIASVLKVHDGAGHDNMMRQHLAKTFAEHGGTVEPTEIASAMNDCAAKARQQLLEGLPI